jgi:hypothetical protein
MSDISDLLPRDKQITVRGVELTVKPLRLSHVLKLSKIGETIQNPSKCSDDEMVAAEYDLNTLINELIPALNGQTLEFGVLIEAMTALMETVEPSDSKELTARGVKLDSDPKAGKSG